ncbi:MAG TPA: TRIC cation channel family protein [Anaeromyxobacter sp.]|nr:TRIC cation channel family protein [Anaeromyxobacter sp.]
MPAPSPVFQPPITLDLAASFFCAVTGALAAVQKRYDLVGLFVLSFVTGVGGALLRDGVFLQEGAPAVVRDGRYLLAVAAAAAVVAVSARHLHRLRTHFVVADAIALGIYAIVGAQKTLAAGLPAVAAVLVGVVNAVGGGILRDVLVREEPLIFRPSELYAVAALAGAGLFVVLVVGLEAAPATVGPIAIVVTIAVRLLAIRLGWRTEAIWREDRRA